jgi:hypothetical protein
VRRDLQSRLRLPVVTTAAIAPQPKVLAQAPSQPERRAAATSSRNPFRFYAMACLALTLIGIGLVWNANRRFNAEMYDEQGMTPAAEAFSKGLNYATFDLNINIRKLRDEHVARMTRAPDVVFFGASQLQEAHKELLPGYDFYNSHIHRDYWQDLFAVTDIWDRHGRLPKKIVISIRDKIFTPMELRTDFLWEPGIPYWREMAGKMKIAMEPVWQSLPYQRLRERLSLSMLFTNVARWYNAEQLPHATPDQHFKSLDTLLPDGSILWSQDHLNIFTPERSRNESLKFAAFQSDKPPVIEKAGVENFEKLITYLQDKGVKLYFMQPPFNPIYWDAVQGTPYFAGLQDYDELIREIARRHGIDMIGGFSPYKVGCEASQYIDAEHANPACLKKVFDEFMALDAKAGKT